MAPRKVETSTTIGIDRREWLFIRYGSFFRAMYTMFEITWGGLSNTDSEGLGLGGFGVWGCQNEGPVLGSQTIGRHIRSGTVYEGVSERVQLAGLGGVRLEVAQRL